MSLVAGFPIVLSDGSWRQRIAPEEHQLHVVVERGSAGEFARNLKRWLKEFEFYMADNLQFIYTGTHKETEKPKVLIRWEPSGHSYDRHNVKHTIKFAADACYGYEEDTKIQHVDSQITRIR